jgi:non-ribosomal peptide synthetase component F
VNRTEASDFQLSADVSVRVRELAREQGMSIFMVLLAAFEVTLYAATGREDFTVGTLSSGRGRQELVDLVGAFINPLPLVARLDPDLPFAAVLAGARQTTLDALAHDGLPFDAMCQAARVSRIGARSWPLLPVQLVWQESERQRQDVQSSLLFEPVPCHHDLTDMDFYVFMSERGGCIGGSCDYAAELFSAERIARLISAFCDILEQGCSDPRRSVRELAGRVHLEPAAQTLPPPGPRRPARPQIVRALTDMFADLTGAPCAPESDFFLSGGTSLQLCELAAPHSACMGYRYPAESAVRDTKRQLWRSWWRQRQDEAHGSSRRCHALGEIECRVVGCHGARGPVLGL